MGRHMCSKCVSEKPCACKCLEHLAVVQGEFYPFEIIKTTCDDCEHTIFPDNK